MADRAGTLGALAPGVLGGALVGALGLAVAGATLAAVAAGGIDPGALWADRYLRGVVGFTLVQAGLSAALSVIFGVAVARAWTRRPGWAWTRWGLSLAMVTPASVAALGVIAVWGRAGWLADAGLPVPNVYGLAGILLGHVFLSGPLIARVCHGALLAIPPGRWRMASQLGLSPWAVWRLVEAPALARVIPGAAGMVFLVSFTSFALVLLLGGGPATSTLEVAIYQAARLDFDLGRAAGLALVQVAICGAVLMLLSRWPVDWAGGRGGRAVPRPDRAGWGGRLTDLGVGLAAMVLVGLPLLALVWRGVAGLGDLGGEPLFGEALATSVALALASAVITPVLALALAGTRASLALPGRLGPRPGAVMLLDLGSAVFLAVPASVLALGAFLMLRGWVDAFALAPVLVLAGNVLMALPFAVRAVQGRVSEVAARHDRLCAHLGLRGRARFAWVTWPLMRREIGFAAALSAALSVGDLGLVAFFGGPGAATLPWLIYQTAGRYQTESAAAMALVLLGLSLGLFRGIERWIGGRNADT